MILLFLACGSSGAPDLDTGTSKPADTDDGGETTALGAVLVSEVMSDPSLVDGDFGEFIELTNVGDADLDLAGMVIQDDDDAGFAIEGSLVLPAGGHVVLGPSGDTAVNGGVPVDFVYSVDAVKLGNEGDTVSVVDDGTVLDSFTWDETVHTLAEGASIQLSGDVTSAEDADAPTAWCLSTTPYGDGDLGTPGAKNGVCG